MGTTAEQQHQPTLTVEVTPPEVDAGAKVTFRVRAACPHGCDLAGATIQIREEGGAVLAEAEVERHDDGSFATGDIVVRAPLAVGDHACTAVLSGGRQDGIGHAASAAIPLAVTAHAAYLHTWDGPSAIAAGEPFAVKLGLKCSSGCNLGGRAFRILDQDGVQVVAGVLRDEIWPGTAALYYAEAVAAAPGQAREHTWSVDVPAADIGGVPHAAGSVRLAVRTVAAPDHEVKIEVIDRASRTPVSGVPVVLHPYRALTDENGIARIRLAKGSYRLHVSGRRYVPCEDLIHADGDLAVRVELAAEVPTSPFFPMPVEQQASVAEVIR